MARITFTKAYKERLEEGYQYVVKANGKQIGVYDPSRNTVVLEEEYSDFPDDPVKDAIVDQVDKHIRRKAWLIGARPAILPHSLG